MNMKLLAWIVLPVAGLIVVGVLVSWLVGAIFSAISWVLGAVFYLALGVAAVGVIMWGWSKMRNSVGGSSSRKELP